MKVKEVLIMKLHELKPAPGSRKTSKRLGRGTGSGLGRNSGKEKRVKNLEVAVVLD